MTDLDELIRDSMADRAAGPVDASRLASTARTRAALRQRRHLLRSGLVGVVALAVMAGAALVLRPLWSDGRPPAVLPPAAEVGAAEAPELVGTQPLVVHFGAPSLIMNARHYEWSTGPGWEQLFLGGYLEAFCIIAIGHDQSTLDAIVHQGGEPYVLRTAVAGLAVRIVAPGEERARQLLAALNFHQAQSIILPFAVGTLPAGVKPTGAYVSFLRENPGSNAVYTQGGVQLSRASATMEVQSQYEEHALGKSDGNYPLSDGRMAYLYPGRDELELLAGPGLYVSVRIGKAYGGFTVEDAAAVLSTVTLAADPTDVSTWPRPAIPG